MLSAEVTIQPQFYDLDPMKVVWHGNYPRFLEVARSALLDRIGYNYTEMAASGFVWPIVDLHVKYMRPIKLGQTIRVSATLVEFEPRMRIAYRIADAVTGDALTKASTTQLAVEMASGHTLLEAPPQWIELVRGGIAMRRRLQAVMPVVVVAALLALFIAALLGLGASAQTVSLHAGQVLRGHFVQERHMRDFRLPVRSEGQFVLAPGQGLIWRTIAPFDVTTVFTSAGVVQRVAGDEIMRLSAAKLPFLDRLQAMLAGALGGDWRALESDFQLTRSDGRVTLAPKHTVVPGPAGIQRIEARIGRFVDAVEIIHADGNSDTLTFSDQQVGDALTDTEAVELTGSSR